MVKARKIISIIEGFKLGSLGVSNKPNITPIEVPRVQELSSQPTIIEVNWSEPFKFYSWTETIKTKKQAKFLDELVQKQYVGGAMDIVFSIEKDQQIALPKLNITYRIALPKLNITYRMKKKGKLIGTKTIELGIKTLRFNRVDEGLEWLHRMGKQIKTEGVAALGFPDKWEIHNFPLI